MPLGGGRRRAVLVGINYYGTREQRGGCVDDVAKMCKFIQGFGYPPQETTILVDDPSWNTALPTRSCILQALSNLARTARPNDHLFFGFSGLGGTQRDKDGDEEDEYDETLRPADFIQAGEITDEELFQVLVKPLPRGARLTAIIDACHSGTVLDLPYTFVAHEGKMRQIFSQGELNPKAHPRMVHNAKWDRLVGKLEGPPAPSCPGGQGSALECDETLQVAGEVVLFSGRQGHSVGMRQPSGAASQVSGAGPTGRGGACLNALLRATMVGPGQTFIELLENMRLIMRAAGEDEVPQLSCSRPMKLTNPFGL